MLKSHIRQYSLPQKRLSTGSMYVQQVERFLANLPKAQAHVVQCIAPNADWRQWRFDNLHVLKQMR